MLSVSNLARSRDRPQLLPNRTAQVQSWQGAIATLPHHAVGTNAAMNRCVFRHLNLWIFWIFGSLGMQQIATRLSLDAASFDDPCRGLLRRYAVIKAKALVIYTETKINFRSYIYNLKGWRSWRILS